VWDVFIVIRDATNQNKALNLAAAISSILNAILGFGKSRGIKQLAITTEQFFRWLYAVVFYTFEYISLFPRETQKIWKPEVRLPNFNKENTISLKVSAADLKWIIIDSL